MKHYNRGPRNRGEGTVVFIMEGASIGPFARMRGDYYDDDYGRVYHVDVLSADGEVVRRNLKLNKDKMVGPTTKNFKADP